MSLINKNNIKIGSSLTLTLFGLVLLAIIVSFSPLTKQHELQAMYRCSNGNSKKLVDDKTKKHVFTLLNLYTRLGICFD